MLFSQATAALYGAVLPSFGIPSVEDLIGDLVEFFHDGAEQMILMMVHLITSSFLPTPEQMQSDPFMLFTGGTLGLAMNMTRVLLIILAVYIILTARQNHSRSITRALTTVFYLIAIQLLILPIYNLLYQLSLGLVDAMINLVVADDTSPKGITALLTDGWPSELFVALMTVAVTAVFALAATGSAITAHILLIACFVTYPLVVGLRAIGVTFLFHLYNSILLTLLATPPIMAFGLLLPVFVGDLPLPGPIGAVVQILTLIVGLGFAIVAPLVLAVTSYRQSKEVFGRVDATVAGKVDIRSMPPATTNEKVESATDSNNLSTKALAGAAGAAGAAGVATVLLSDQDGGNRDEFIKSLTRTASTAVSTASTAAGHPYIGAAVKGGEKLLVRDNPKTPPGEGE